MDPVVTARVPAGIRARGVDVLHEIGSNPSELINAAFDYVIQERKLPKPTRRAAQAIEKRTLDDAQRAEFNSFMNAIHVPVPREWDNLPFEQLLDQAMEERYAGLR